MILYILCLILFAVGLYGVFIKKDLIKMIMGINIMGLAVNLFLIMIGYKTGGRYPILSKEELHIAKNLFSQMVDPIPQALVLTAIVIELGIIGLLVSLAIRLYEKYGTFDVTKIRRLKG